MARILKVNPDTVSIGIETGEIIEVRIEDLNFTPAVDDVVEVYKSDKETIVRKVDVAAGSTFNIFKTDYNYAIGKTAVNKVVYALLAILLGAFGIHKFYVGKPTSGVLYLIFCWTFIPGLISFIEGIMAIAAKEDENGNIYV